MGKKIYILEYLINYVENNSPDSNEQSILDTLFNVLSDGFFLTDNDIEKICCCDKCGLNGTTVFSSVETWLKYAEAVGLTGVPGGCSISGLTCCLSVDASVETYLKFAEAIGFTGPSSLECINAVNSCCNLDFTRVINEMKKNYGTEITYRILDKGFVLLGDMTIEPLLQYLNNKSDYFRYTYIDILIDTGLIFNCTDKIVSSVETYLKYAEAVGLTTPGDGGPVPA